MSTNNFLTTNSAAWKKLFWGKDYELYRQFEGDDSTMDDAKNKIYKINWKLFVVVVISCFFLSYILWFFLFSFLWYKPLCHMLHLRNRTKRLNIIEFASARNLLEN